MSIEAPRQLEWVGSTKADIKNFPEAVREVLSYSLFLARVGLRNRSIKAFRGLRGNVVEVISRHDGDTFRAVYTVRFGAVGYMLHVFQKKAERGIATPEPEIDLIRGRLRAAEQRYRQNHWGG